MHMSNQSLLVILLVGIVAGWLAGKIVRGTGFGIIGDLLVGIAAVHDRRMFGDDLVEPAGLGKGRQPLGLGKADRRTLVRPVAGRDRARDRDECDSLLQLIDLQTIDLGIELPIEDIQGFLSAKRALLMRRSTER